MPTYIHDVISYPKPTKRLLFIHIPRTGGRFFHENLKLNGFHDEAGLNRWDSMDGVELTHFHRDLYEKYLDIEGIPHIAIVRNPINKFFSASSFFKRMYGEDIQELMEDEFMFFNMLNNFPLTESVNWFRPQSDFVSDKTHIWRFEDGLGKEFAEWVSDILKITFTIQDVPYRKLTYDESNKLERTDKLIDNVRKICTKDIEQFYPELATPLKEREEEKVETASIAGSA